MLKQRKWMMHSMPSLRQAIITERACPRAAKLPGYIYLHLCQQCQLHGLVLAKLTTTFTNLLNGLGVVIRKKPTEFSAGGLLIE